MSFSVGGLASGLDTKSIVEQLLSIDARPKVQTEWSKALWTERKNVWTDVNTRLLTLQSKANVLNNPLAWTGGGTTSSDPTKLTGAVGGPSPATGTYTINVTQLAATERWTAANEVTSSGADTLTITQGTNTWNIAIAAGADENAIMAAINGTSGIGVTASVVAGKLQIDSNASATTNSFTVTSSGALATDLGMAETVAGQDTVFDVNGTSYTRAKSQGIDDVIGDVKLDLLATTSSAVTLTVGAGAGDPTAIKNKIKEFVDAYNSVIDLINAKTSETKVVNAKTLGDFLKGPMARDYGLSSVAFDVRRWTTDTVSGLPDAFNALDDIGITTGAVSSSYSPQNTSGRLVIDEAKLDAALAADPSRVQTLLTHVGAGPGREDNGITRRISDLVTELRVGGRVDSALQGTSRQIKDLQSRIDRFDDRLDRKRTYYERMFSSLETTLGKLQSQGYWLSSQLAGMYGGQQQ